MASMDAPSSPRFTEFTHALTRVLDDVARAATNAGREPSQVSVLLAVKTQTPQDIITAMHAMHAMHAMAQVAASPVILGHNRVQEMVASGPALSGPHLPAHEMHLIGPLQSNKINHALPWATSIDTVASLDLAERLSRTCERLGRTRLNVRIQVNVSHETTKSGCGPDEALDLALAVAQLPHLCVRGFMTIGLRSPIESEVRAGYERLRLLRDAVVSSGREETQDAWDLSMGMTNDLAWAIAEGATTVRVGRAVFGERHQGHSSRHLTRRNPGVHQPQDHRV